ncbi:tryptophan synthase beta subunit-like PLP-dependent enzyme [Aspergillus cavernicola]|uniref:tryptophan synthase n=1 Tax=Aspergillus cavernicola TaxID=176166 RepID=A0ABR4HGL1_9EURO
MPVSVRSQPRSRHYPYPTRWRKTKNERHILPRVPEEKYLNPLIKGLNLNLADLLHTPTWSRHQITIPAVNAPTHFGKFGGQFAPELQMDILLDLSSVFHSILSDDTFWDDFIACPLIRPSPLHFAQNLTQVVGGANIWLKREDLNPFGSYQARNIVGQILFAHRIGKTEIVMDCGYAGHGLVCATMCARMSMKCTIHMGASDLAAQPDAVEKMGKLGATVISAHSPEPYTNTRDKGSLRAATNEALRYSLSHLDSTYHITSGTIGPHPLPSITRTFQSLLGKEIKNYISSLTGRKRTGPDALISPVGSSGAAALGMFAPFIADPTVRLIGVEAADAAPLTNGSVGVMYGCKTLLLQDDDGQILPSHSIAPDLNFPCAGPELAFWKDTGRMGTVVASNEEAVQGLRVLCECEGIVSSLATGYAVLETVRVARELGVGRDVVLLVSG